MLSKPYYISVRFFIKLIQVRCDSIVLEKTDMYCDNLLIQLFRVFFLETIILPILYNLILLAETLQKVANFIYNLIAYIIDI
jgi:hypothetical protein